MIGREIYNWRFLIVQLNYLSSTIIFIYKHFYMKVSINRSLKDNIKN